jgi:hypothetical protein
VPVSPRNWIVSEVPSADIARQLALHHMDLFKKVPSYEWFPKHSSFDPFVVGASAPNLLRMASYADDMGRWICSDVLRLRSLKARSGAVAKWIEIAKVSCAPRLCQLSCA